MKILILSCKTGEGHNSAALAIQKALQDRGADSVIMDPVSFSNEKTKQKVCNLYNKTIVKQPKLFGMVYQIGDMYNKTFKNSPVYYANSLYADKLYEYLVKEKYDAVCCTHLYGAEAMTAIRRKYDFKLPCSAVLTDYTCVPFFNDARLDYYFIPHSDLANEMVEKGVPANLLIPSGIPVADRFVNHLSYQQARTKLKLPDSKYVYVIMSGGVGCGNISEICQGIINREDYPFIGYVLAGHNNKLTKTLRQQFENDERFKILSFTTDVADYMAAADVLITKPGGLSSTEAAVVNVPMVHLITIPGCETKNAQFFMEHQMSVVSKTTDESAEMAVKLVHDCQACQLMRQKQAEQINPQAAAQIAEKVMKL